MAPVEDAARLDRILQKYGSDPDVVWVVERCQPRHTRVSRRDAAVRDALALFEGSVTARARQLAAALQAYVQTEWSVERHLVEPATSAIADPRRRALHAVLYLNEGRPLAYRRIIDIFK